TRPGSVAPSRNRDTSGAATMTSVSETGEYVAWLGMRISSNAASRSGRSCVVLRSYPRPGAGLRRGRGRLARIAQPAEQRFRRGVHLRGVRAVREAQVGARAEQCRAAVRVGDAGRDDDGPRMPERVPQLADEVRCAV